VKVRRAAYIPILWRVLRNSRRPDAPGFSARFAALPRLVRDTVTGRYRGVSRGWLGLVALAVVYIVSPVDLVPEAFLTVFGLADDVAVIAWVAAAVLVETDRYLEWERSRPLVVKGAVVRP
jgi:uncharacterized membrane protein YkvA (DUF1232 family)